METGDFLYYIFKNDRTSRKFFVDKFELFYLLFTTETYFL